MKKVRLSVNSTAEYVVSTRYSSPALYKMTAMITIITNAIGKIINQGNPFSCFFLRLALISLVMKLKAKNVLFTRSGTDAVSDED